MVRVVTDYLDISAQKYPEKIAFADENRSITFCRLQQEAWCAI
jgi:non-ribosomal peptide synthetase component E (peptide arylation enzyme)